MSTRPRLLAGALRLPTVGLLLVVTLVAFEALAVATVMPTTARALHGLALYSLGFTAFLGASLVGMVDAGARTDRRGPGPVLIGGLAAFGVGLLGCAAAPTMPVFIAGRAVSGLGAGAIIVALYVLVARVYDEALRPQVFAAMSGAWVVPALVGPALAGTVTEHLGWRWIYGGLPPFIALGALLLLPALRTLPPHPGTDRRAPAVAALLLAAGVALVQLASAHVTPLRLALALAGLVLLARPLQRLLPAGTLLLQRGLPATVACRALLAGAFFGAEVFLPLTLVTVHGARPTLAGLPLTFGAVGWFAGSWLQGRSSEQRRARLLPLGFVLVGVGVGSVALLTSPAVPAWTAILPWGIAGAGMGMAMPAISLLTLRLSPQQEQGENAAALQISDAVGSAVSIAMAGAVVAAAGAAGHAVAGITAVDLLLAAVAVAGSALALRTRVSGAR